MDTETGQSESQKRTDAETATARAYREVAETRAGAVMIADLEARFACNPFAEGKPDLTAFRCGCLRVLQEIGDQIRRGSENQETARQETAL